MTMLSSIPPSTLPAPSTSPTSTPTRLEHGYYADSTAAPRSDRILFDRDVLQFLAQWVRRSPLGCRDRRAGRHLAHRPAVVRLEADRHDTRTGRRRRRCSLQNPNDASSPRSACEAMVGGQELAAQELG
jgi:hypothetical protein